MSTKQTRQQRSRQRPRNSTEYKTHVIYEPYKQQAKAVVRKHEKYLKHNEMFVWEAESVWNMVMASQHYLYKGL